MHNSVNISNHVKWRQADLGLIHFPYNDKDVEARVIREGQVVCVMPKGHPLAGKSGGNIGRLSGNGRNLLPRWSLAQKKVLRPVMPHQKWPNASRYRS
ncbi:LysR substrate-binding domain-containing protein [Vibrio sinaloensis]|nr:LysR substrate-binding domain-containing protein [Vibrio sinaloensis]